MTTEDTAANVLLTGATGYVGGRLRRALEERRSSRQAVWYAWLDVALSVLEWSPGECLRRLPSRDGDGHAKDIRWLLEALASTGVIRLDCGRLSYLPAPADDSWSEDRFYCCGSSAKHLPTVLEGGRALQSDSAVVFQTSREFDRYDYRPGYTIPLRRTLYTVTLHFCEGWAGAAGVRLFDVLIEGKPVTDLTAYDGFARDGFGELASYRVPVTVKDGLLEIEFRTRKNGAAVAAIEVRPAE